MVQRSHPIVEVNRIAIVQNKVRSTKKSADICIKYHMEDDPEGQEVMRLLDAIDAKLTAMINIRVSAMREAA